MSRDQNRPAPVSTSLAPGVITLACGLVLIAAALTGVLMVAVPAALIAATAYLIHHRAAQHQRAIAARRAHRCAPHAGPLTVRRVLAQPRRHDYLRIGRRERDVFLKHLSDAYANEELDAGEFEERQARVQDAKTLGELRPVVHDLRH
ncbi:DUF1707 SHOCT-like domain-containing protein [Spirillospora sp. CA-253888]